MANSLIHSQGQYEFWVQSTSPRQRGCGTFLRRTVQRRGSLWITTNHQSESIDSRATKKHRLRILTPSAAAASSRPPPPPHPHTLLRIRILTPSSSSSAAASSHPPPLPPHPHTLLRLILTPSSASAHPPQDSDDSEHLECFSSRFIAFNSVTLQLVSYALKYRFAA